MNDAWKNSIIVVLSSAFVFSGGVYAGVSSRNDEVDALMNENVNLMENVNALSAELEDTKLLLSLSPEMASKCNAKIRIERNTRGVRNRNPGNVHALSSKEPWLGQIGKDRNGSAIFRTFEHGLRAQYLVLKKYYEKHGIDTLLKLTSKYCEGDAVKYAKFIGHEIGVHDINAKIDFMHHMPKIMKAMVRYENGWDLFPDEYYVPYAKGKNV